MNFWQNLAKCKDGDPSIFYDETPENLARAKQVCAGCPVARQCLEAGMSESFGIWGGLSTRERKRLKRRRAVAS